MPRPSTTPDWASDTSYPAGSDPWSGTPTRVEPDPADRAKGLVPGTRPPAQWLNWIFGGVSDWIAYLRDERDRLDAYCTSEGVQLPAPIDRVLYFGPHDLVVADPADWDRAFDDRAVANGDSTRGFFDLTKRLPRNAQIRRVFALVTPGVARSIEGQRMSMTLYRHAYSTPYTNPASVSSLLIGTTCRDLGTTATQWIQLDLASSPEDVDQGDAWVLQVRAGVDASMNNDTVWGAAVEIRTDTIRID